METPMYVSFPASSSWFKSYYVVWKRNTKRNMGKEFQGLNRTMQYGNSKEKIIPFKNKAGLNRTMQYGNKR